MFIASELGNLGYDYVHGAVRYWPVVLILLGASKVLRGHDAGEAVGGGFFVIGGVWLLLSNLGIVDVSFWFVLRTYWPVLLVAASESPPEQRDMTEKMADALPNARLARIDGGHLIDPAGTEVLTFIEELPTTG